MIPLVDISRYQGAVDMAVIRDAGIPGIIIRAGNGVTPDPACERNMAEAARVGLKRSAYWFCNPKATISGATQGTLLAQAHDRYGCELPPMWDVESYTNEGGTNPELWGAPAARWLAEFVHETDRARFSLGYTNASFWNGGPLKGRIAPTFWDQLAGRYTPEWEDDLAFLHSHDFIQARYPGQHKAAGMIVDYLPRGKPPAEWEVVAMGTGKEPPNLALRDRPWDGWQWSAGGNAQGPVYGCGSNDLDLNIIRPDAWERWTTVEVEMAKNYYVVTGANAAFIGDDVDCHWTGPGSQAMDAVIAAHLAAGRLVRVDVTGGPMAMNQHWLQGELPYGDNAYTWTGVEFANAIQIQAAHAPLPAVDQAARDGLVALQGTVASLDQELGRTVASLDATKLHLREAGT